MDISQDAPQPPNNLDPTTGPAQRKARRDARRQEKGARKAAKAAGTPPPLTPTSANKPKKVKINDPKVDAEEKGSESSVPRKSTKTNSSTTPSVTQLQQKHPKLKSGQEKMLPISRSPFSTTKYCQGGRTSPTLITGKRCFGTGSQSRTDT